MSVAQTIFENVKFPPEKFAETRLVATLAATTRELYSELSEIEPWLAWLRGVAIDRNVNVSVIVEGTVADKRYEDVLSFGAAALELEDELPLNVPFDYDARVYEYNAAVAPIANYQSRVTWEVQPYRVADKLSMGLKYENLDEDEQRLADKYKIMRSIRGGKLPMPYPKGDLQYQFAGQYAGNPVAGDAGETNIIRRTCPDGYKLVLTKLWANHPVANFGDLEIRVYRDKKLFLTLYPYCFPNYADPVRIAATISQRYIPPVELWIPALSSMRVTIYSGTGHVGILAQALVELRRLTIWDKMAWGLEAKRKITSQEERDLISELNLRDKLDAGIYELVTPIPESAILGSP